MVPYLATIDLIRVRRVSKGFQLCVDLGTAPNVKKNKEGVDDYYMYINNRLQTNLLKNCMLEKYKYMLKHGVSKKEYVVENSYFTNNEASMSLLIFYLRKRAPKILNKILHCYVKKWAPYNRRLFRRMHLSVEMYLLHTKKVSLNKSSINCKKKDIKKCMSEKINSAEKKISLPNLPLTEENLSVHNNANKRKRLAIIKREAKKPKTYQEEYQQNVVVQDDFIETVDIVDDKSDCSEGIEKRSIDSKSAGSLEDFVVDDEEDDDATVSAEERNSEREEEWSERETDEDSVCTSDMSGIFSDNDE